MPRDAGLVFARYLRRVFSQLLSPPVTKSSRLLKSLVDFPSRHHRIFIAYRHGQKFQSCYSPPSLCRRCQGSICFLILPLQRRSFPRSRACGPSVVQKQSMSEHLTQRRSAHMVKEKPCWREDQEKLLKGFSQRLESPKCKL